METSLFNHNQTTTNVIPPIIHFLWVHGDSGKKITTILLFFLRRDVLLFKEQVVTM